MQLRVTAGKGEAKGTLSAGDMHFPCALGPAGLVPDKREGDGGTPVAAMALMTVFYRPDRVARPATRLMTDVILPDHRWCDDPELPAYNMLVSAPFDGGCETMWRDDHVYDICVILDWNLAPPIPGQGSAIFFHLARAEYQPTEGCVAVSEEHMRKILALCGPGSELVTVVRQGHMTEG